MLYILCFTLRYLCGYFALKLSFMRETVRLLECDLKLAAATIF